MIPLIDVTPTRTRPMAAVGIIVTQAIVFAAVRTGMLGEPGAVAAGLAPATWTGPGLAAALFTHANGLLLAADLIALWLFGPTVEDRLGHDRFVALWIGAGLAAGAAQIVATPASAAPLLGAPGAVAGIIAAFLLLTPRSRILMAMPVLIGFELTDVPAWLLAAVWVSVLLAASVTLSIAAPIAVVAGGAAAGVAGRAWLARPERQRVEWWCE